MDEEVCQENRSVRNAVNPTPLMPYKPLLDVYHTILQLLRLLPYLPRLSSVHCPAQGPRPAYIIWGSYQVHLEP